MSKFCVNCGARKLSSRGSLCETCVRPIRIVNLKRGRELHGRVQTIATEIKNNRERILEVLS